MNKLIMYNFGFNGQEKDDEIQGDGNSLDFGARIYDPRLGRWLSVDPEAAKFTNQSPFSFAANCPLSFTDKNGEEIIPVSEAANTVFQTSLVQTFGEELAGLIKNSYKPTIGAKILSFNNIDLKSKAFKQAMKSMPAAQRELAQGIVATINSEHKNYIDVAGGPLPAVAPNSVIYGRKSFEGFTPPLDNLNDASSVGLSRSENISENSQSFTVTSISDLFTEGGFKRGWTMEPKSTWSPLKFVSETVTPAQYQSMLEKIVVANNAAQSKPKNLDEIDSVLPP